MERKILLLGDKRLYEKSIPIEKDEIESLAPIITDMHDTLMAFRKKYKVGRAIAAPQIGVFKRLIYMHVDQPLALLNPILNFTDTKMIEVMDDCMSFPNLLVLVNRYKKCRIAYRDTNWKQCVLHADNDIAELLQHEYDHLDGILATMKAIDNKSFYVKK